MMAAIVGAAIVAGVITACVGPLYFYNRAIQGRDDSDGGYDDVDSPTVRIRISHPPCNEVSKNVPLEGDGNFGYSANSRNGKERRSIAQEATIFPQKESQIVSVPLPRNEHRVSAKIWSPALRNQLENLTNSSSEACGVTKVVKAQVEVYPEESTHKQSLTSSKRQSFRRGDNSEKSSPKEIFVKDEKTRKLPSAAAKKWKNFKKTFIRSRRKPMQLKEVEKEEIQRLTVPASTSGHRSPVGHSTVLQKNRLIDASTSTKISSYIDDLQQGKNEIVVQQKTLNRNNESPSKSCRSRCDQCPNTESLLNVESLIKRRSVNEKSTCDVRITGLAMNQSELLDLLEATGSKSQSASIITTEEACIISIKFPKDGQRTSDSGVRVHEDSFFECPLTKFYRNLPEKFENITFSRLFRSHVQSGRSDRNRSVHISDRSTTLNTSRNETSYIRFPSRIGRECNEYTR